MWLSLSNNKIFYFSKPNFNILPILSFCASHGGVHHISKDSYNSQMCAPDSIHLKPHSWELSSCLAKNLSFYFFFKSSCQLGLERSPDSIQVLYAFNYSALCHLLWSLDNSDQMKCNNQNQQVSPLPWQTPTRKGHAPCNRSATLIYNLRLFCFQSE